MFEKRPFFGLKSVIDMVNKFQIYACRFASSNALGDLIWEMRTSDICARCGKVVCRTGV
jgi:hypothetical protein